MGLENRRTKRGERMIYAWMGTVLWFVLWLTIGRKESDRIYFTLYIAFWSSLIISALLYGIRGFN